MYVDERTCLTKTLELFRIDPIGTSQNLLAKKGKYIKGGVGSGATQ